MKLHYATTNAQKVLTLQQDLAKYHLEIVQVPLNLPEPRSSDVQEIAREKIIFAYQHIKQPVVSLDAGFYIHALGGFPRAYVNFALETIGLDGLLKLVADKDRQCEFRECLAYLDKTLSGPQYFLGHFKGTLAHQPQGTIQPHHWSPLALLFIPAGETRTLAEMDYAQYCQWRLATAATTSEKQFADWFSARKLNQTSEVLKPSKVSTRIIDQSWYKRPAGVPIHQTAGGVIARLENGQIYIALIRDGNYSGYLLPKGRIEPGEGRKQAARREIAEEAGLSNLKFITKLGIRKRLNYSKTSWKKTHYFLFVTSQVTGQPTDLHHIYHLEWFPLRELPPMFWLEQRELLESQRDKIEKLVYIETGKTTPAPR